MDQIAIGQLGIPSLILMENAGLRCAQEILSRFTRASFTILCGPGNNGADGLVIARQLAVLGRAVTVWVSGNPASTSPECSTNWVILKRLNLPNLDWKITQNQCGFPVDLGNGSEAVIIDAMLGISARGEPRSPMSDMIQWANRQSAVRVAIDVPTGLDPDSGAPSENTFRSDLTLTIERPKMFAANPDACGFIGELVVIPLGIPEWVVRAARDDSK